MALHDLLPLEYQDHHYSSALGLLNAKHKLVKPKGFGSEPCVETTNTGWRASLEDVKTRGSKIYDQSLMVQPVGQPAQTGSISPFLLTR